MALHLEGQDDDGDFVNQLRALQAQYQAGTIDRAAYDAAYRLLDRRAGTLCRCQRGVVTVQTTRGALCAPCYLETK